MRSRVDNADLSSSPWRLARIAAAACDAKTMPTVSSWRRRRGARTRKVQRACGAFARVELERQPAANADLTCRGRVFRETRSSSEVLGANDDLVESRLHAWSLAEPICSSSNRCVRSSVPASEANLPPLPTAARRQCRRPAKVPVAAAVTSDRTSSMLRGAAVARASSAIRRARS